MADKIKIGLAALLVIAGLAGFYYFAESLAIVRLGSVLAGLAAAAFVFWTTEPGKQFYVYAQESVVETRKVVWPTRKETLQTTAVVFLFRRRDGAVSVGRRREPAVDREEAHRPG